MKDILKEVKNNITSRLKNHLIGSYLFSWVICHLKSFLLFLMSPTDTQFDIISSSQFSVQNDLYNPLILMSLYLFVIPFLNVQYERVFYFFQKERNQIKSRYLVGFYSETMESNHAKVKSDVSHIKNIMDKELEGWGSQKKAIINLKMEYAKRVREKELELKNFQGKNKILSQKLDSLNSVHQRFLTDNNNKEIKLKEDLHLLSLSINNDDSAAIVDQIREILQLDEEIPF